MKFRDPKVNLEPDENLANSENAINFTMMILVSPFLAHQLSVLMTIDLYGGSHESGNRWQHKGM
jgi:hypothetical protein